ncbi:SDR family oxidoreductase [Mycolicibacterium vaccae]|uniref:Short chain dehydrogenase n=1 Tax=Mycolicibacterium vaccae ATCC 25954 TaxID=1194972 RepID=K0UBN7_MYCVA|nr:SDR family oxidoreductase [Mycolicibacterium vaccae]ANI40150.1 short-chain dehydrogenase [Mycolicibacterium vaccae 95051]EJZ04732.1 short chain dehydrogenase [Mycolicibacterium vaccae ATCC 25954]MCV7060113.1 SDR family oxidoreductase [Mycolicibacterium vaccae]
MDVLITGCDTDLGRTIAENFSEAGHNVLIGGRRREELEVLAKELDVDALVFDNTDPASVAELHGRVPAHLDTIINVPAPTWTAGDPRTYTLDDHAAEWRGLFDAGVVAPMLTVQVLGDHMRSGGSIVTVIPDFPREGGAASAVKAAVSDWTAGLANHFGIRGITVNAVAVGRGVEPGYDGLSNTPPTVASEISRLSLFLTTGSARHITGQTLHVTHGALANFG